MHTEAFKFLELFPEIRDKIYFTFLSSPLPVIPISEAEILHRDGIPTTSESWLERCSKYPPFPPHITSTPLLLCNRQIHAEFKESIARFLNGKNLCYELDCEMICESYIYPTWLLVPVYAKHVPYIYTNFRLSGEATVSHWAGGVGGPPRMIWSLLDILLRFLQRGPHFSSPIKTRDITVDTLVLNVSTPFLKQGVTFKEVCYNPYGDECEVGTLIHPETVVEYLQENLMFLFGGSHHTLEYRKLVAAKVKKVYLCYDGVEKAIWDLESTEYLH